MTLAFEAALGRQAPRWRAFQLQCHVHVNFIVANPGALTVMYLVLLVRAVFGIKFPACTVLTVPSSVPTWAYHPPL